MTFIATYKKIVVTVLALAMFVGVVFFAYTKFTPKQDKVLPNNTLDDQASWPTFVFNGYRFSYPSSWTLRENSYATPAMEAESIPQDTIGYSLIYKTVPKGNGTFTESIEVGGRQTSCDNLPVTAHCIENPLPTIYTLSTDPMVVSMFEKVVASATTTTESSNVKN